ncbi:MAG: histone H1 [Chloroflexota bacterium]
MEKYEALKAMVEEMEADFKKFYDDNNKAAGTRVRKGMLDLKKFADETRKNVQEIKNAG